MATTVNELRNADRELLGWGRVLTALVLILAALVLIYSESAWSMVFQWMSSDTYAHGFLIVPISLWLIWEKRRGLATASPDPTLFPVALMVPVGMGWLLAHLVGVAVVQQYAFVTLVILVIWSLIGTPVARYLAFPIGFLLFMVPVGEGLVHPMMGFTADFTVGMLRLTGVPVYRDGTFFSIPSGDWSVVAACSGIRYLLASVTLGVLYAYLTYTKLWKRLAFVLFAIAVPVVANGLRAYIIVMIAHLSDMRLATGVDHLIYGWVFFGIVIAIMFAIGSIWRDPPATLEAIAMPPRSKSGLLQVALAALVAAGFWSGLAWALERAAAGGDAAVVVHLPPPAGAWASDSGELWNWRPKVQGADGSVWGFYRSAGGPASLSIAVYRSQRQGAELINALNQMALEGDPEWSNKESSARAIETSTGEMRVNQNRLVSRQGQHLLVWYWYRVGDRQTSNPVTAKLLEAGYRLIHGRRDGALIAVATPMGESEGSAASLLEDFISTMSPIIAAQIDRSVLVPAP